MQLLKRPKLSMVLWLGLVAPGMVQGQEFLSRERQFLGCYALFAANKPVDRDYYNSSPRVRLDSTLVTRGSRVGRFILQRLDHQGRPRDVAGPRTFPFTWSLNLVGDSLSISFVQMSGTFVVLAADTRGDTLRGRIEEYWDSGPRVTSQQPAQAVRVPCAGA